MRAILTSALVLALGAHAHADTPAEQTAKLIKKLGHKDAGERARAADHLGHLEAVEAVPALAAALRDKDSRVRGSAAGALLRIGEPAKEAMPALQAALLDSNASTVWNAAGALKNMGVVTTDLMPAYRRLLLDPRCDMKVSAAVAIVEYAPAAELLPIALECRNPPVRDDDVAKEVRTLMTAIGKDRTAMPLIVEALSDRDWEVREWAARALGDAGGAARSALPALKVAAKDDDERVRAAAERALARIAR